MNPWCFRWGLLTGKMLFGRSFIFLFLDQNQMSVLQIFAE